jgi:DNA-binding PadR family transcriptional regulator
MGNDKTDVLQGTLDLMVLKTLESMGPLHGYGIARRIEQVSDNGLILNQGTIYPALLRLEQRGWVKAEWDVGEQSPRQVLFPEPNGAQAD